MGVDRFIVRLEMLINNTYIEGGCVASFLCGLLITGYVALLFFAFFVGLLILYSGFLGARRVTLALGHLYKVGNQTLSHFLLQKRIVS